MTIREQRRAILHAGVESLLDYLDDNERYVAGELGIVAIVCEIDYVDEDGDARTGMPFWCSDPRRLCSTGCCWPPPDRRSKNDRPAAYRPRREQQLGAVHEDCAGLGRDGKLPAFKLPGGAIRFREEDLEQWLQERATSGRGSVNSPVDAARSARLSSVGSTVPKTRSEDGE